MTQETFEQIMERMKEDAKICNSRLKLQTSRALNLTPRIVKTRYDEEKPMQERRNEVIKLLSNLESMTFTEIRTQLNLGQYELLGYLRTLLHEKKVRINNSIKPSRWFIVKENHG